MSAGRESSGVAVRASGAVARAVYEVLEPRRLMSGNPVPLDSHGLADGPSVVYIESNNPAPGQNAVLAFRRNPATGALKELAGGPFLTGGTGFLNGQGLLGPDDSDREVIASPDGRLLLGGGGPLDARNYSTLAGFVEPGESLEQAVQREIGEEVGVRVTASQYLGSQSWPFPASLMLGFTATTPDTEARPDGVEVTRARWFSRSELQDAVLSGEIVISSRLSIARSLIEHWYGGVIQDAADSA